MTRSRGQGRDTRYVFRFVFAATLLISATLVLVLYVLPQRYVLSSGFREGNLALPNPSTPFEPVDPLRIAALPPLPPPDEIVRGSAEIFWEQVLPLLEAEQYEAAIPLFTGYLSSYPGDLGVRREYAITLTRAGYGDRAIPVFRALLEYEDDSELRLLLARTLRDEARVAEASEQYAVLVTAAPDDVALIVEWTQALMGVEAYGQAEEVVVAGLERHPDSIPLRVELARLYYYTDRLEEADDILAGLSDDELVAGNATTLRDDVRAALTPPPAPEVEPPPPPTLLEQAVGARENGDLTRAANLFEAALAENPDDVEAWQAYADFLQYELEDFEGALAALEEVDRLTPAGDPELQYRMALLEVWTDHTDDARTRLEALLVLFDADGARAAASDTIAEGDDPASPDVTEESAAAELPVTKADVHALLGDLHRWDGERLPAVDRYRLALVEDPDHTRAIEGLAILQADVDRMMVEAEEPRLGALTRSLADTDDFLSFDLGGEWYGLHNDWVWGTRTGARWLEGIDPAGGTSALQGLFADLEGARWWRWGTIRTALHLGVENVRSNSVDLSAGASARFVSGSGRRTDVRFDHAPAYGSTNTLQAAAANVQQDRFTAAHAQPLSETWSMAATAEAASLDHKDVTAADRNLRVAGGVSVGHAMSRKLTLGAATRALRYMDAAPSMTGPKLYWDPNLSVSVGPYAQYVQTLGTWWELSARINPGFAWIDERGTEGGEAVPDLSATLGLTREGAKYRTRIDVFYGQGRFTGYRSYGINVSFSARGWMGRAVSGDGS